MGVPETMPETKDTQARNARVWFFQVLVVIAAGVMLVSWFMPWWNVDIESIGKNMVQIHPWGLEMNERLGGFKVLLKGTEMPGWFAPLMWAYLSVCMIALLVGLWFHRAKVSIGKFKLKLNQLLIGGVGVSYFVVGIVAAIYASIRTKATMGVPLLGRNFIDMGDPFVTYVDSRFLLGYYLIYVAAILFLILAIFSDKIIGATDDGT
jgi:hypothetical protein